MYIVPFAKPSDPGTGFPIAKTVMAPAGEMFLTLKSPTPLSEADVAQIKAGTHALFVWGEVEYLDIFKVKRTTKFRLFYGGRIGTPESGEMAHDDEGNSAD